MASAAVINKVRSFARQVAACGVSLKKVILFGSYAGGRQTKYSDIDVALVADEFSGVPSEDVKLFLKALRKYYIMQTQTFNPRQFSPDKDPFVEEILRTGIEIKV
jgi:predicted nucleotidyltransferase